MVWYLYRCTFAKMKPKLLFSFMFLYFILLSVITEISYFTFLCWCLYFLTDFDTEGTISTQKQWFLQTWKFCQYSQLVSYRTHTKLNLYNQMCSMWQNFDFWVNNFSEMTSEVLMFWLMDVVFCCRLTFGSCAAVSSDDWWREQNVHVM